MLKKGSTVPENRKYKVTCLTAVETDMNRDILQIIFTALVGYPAKVAYRNLLVYPAVVA